MNTWKELLKEEYEKDYYKNLSTWVKEQYKEKNVFPKQENIFNALKFTPYNNVKVVILGQVLLTYYILYINYYINIHLF